MADKWWTNYLAWGILAMFGTLGCGLLWWLAPRLRQDWWRRQPWQPSLLGGGEVVLFFVFMILLPELIRGFLQSSGFFSLVYGGQSTHAQQFLWAIALALPLILLGTFPLLNVRQPVRPDQIGVTGKRWPHDFLLGFLTWLIVTPLVLGLHLVLTSIWKSDEHPLMQLTHETLMPLEWFLLFFQAVVAAPLIEELAFRGVLQSWLYQASLRGHVMAALTIVLLPGMRLLIGLFGLALAWAGQWIPDLEILAQNIEDQVKFKTMNHGPWIFALAMIPVYCLTWLRWQAVSIEGGAGDKLAEGKPPASEEGKSSYEAGTANDLSPPLAVKPTVHWPNAWPAIVGSALLWAITHASVWPSPIPLFFLGLALGWLACWTQSLIGPIVAHSLFNAVASMVLVWTRES